MRVPTSVDFYWHERTWLLSSSDTRGPRVPCRPDNKLHFLWIDADQLQQQVTVWGSGKKTEANFRGKAGKAMTKGKTQANGDDKDENESEAWELAKGG